MNPSETTAQNSEPTDFLVIGAGLAGLAFACQAWEHGQTACVLDKGRGIGGRMATRRFGGNVRVDHGAQFFTARGARFQNIVDAGLQSGAVIEWSRGFPQWKNGEIVNRPTGHARYACSSGMSDLPKSMAQAVPVETGAQVVEITQTGDGTVYQAVCADGRVFAGVSLILCLPPVQLLALARSLLSSDTMSALDTVVYDPAWTLIAQLTTDLPGADWPAVEFSDHPVLGWVSRDHTKRPGPNAPPVLVAHGSGAWSQAHLEDDPASVQAALLYRARRRFRAASARCAGANTPLAVREPNAAFRNTLLLGRANPNWRGRRLGGRWKCGRRAHERLGISSRRFGGRVAQLR